MESDYKKQSRFALLGVVGVLVMGVMVVTNAMNNAKTPTETVTNASYQPSPSVPLVQSANSSSCDGTCMADASYARYCREGQGTGICSTGFTCCAHPVAPTREVNPSCGFEFMGTCRSTCASQDIDTSAPHSCENPHQICCLK